MQKLIKNVLKILFVITFLHKGFCSKSQQENNILKLVLKEKTKKILNADKTFLLSTLISVIFGYCVNRNDLNKYNFAGYYSLIGIIGSVIGKTAGYYNRARYYNKECNDDINYKKKEKNNLITKSKNIFLLISLLTTSYLFYKNKNNISNHLIDHKNFYSMMINFAVTCFIGYNKKKDGSFAN